MNLSQIDAKVDKFYNLMTGHLSGALGRQTFESGVYLTTVMSHNKSGERGFAMTCTISGFGVVTHSTRTFGATLAKPSGWDMVQVGTYYGNRMDAVYGTLAPDVQAAFATQYVAVKDFLNRGKTDVARQIITNTSAPSGLAATKDVLVALL